MGIKNRQAMVKDRREWRKVLFKAKCRTCEQEEGLMHYLNVTTSLS
jgi:hypothetical protein